MSDEEPEEICADGHLVVDDEPLVVEGPGLMEVELVEIADLVADERNARRGDTGALMDSLREFGQHRAVVAQRQSRRIVAGNHLVDAARGLGWTHVTVTWVDDDDDMALRRALTDNLVGDRSKWDDDQLAALLAEVDDVASLPGIDDKMLRQLVEDDMDRTEAPARLPIQPRMGEKYSYVVIVARQELDGVWLEEQFSLPRLQSYKAESHIGRSRVIDVADLKTALNEAIVRGEPIR